jgi:hypothetical protein
MSKAKNTQFLIDTVQTISSRQYIKNINSFPSDHAKLLRKNSHFKRKICEETSGEEEALLKHKIYERRRKWKYSTFNHRFNFRQSLLLLLLFYFLDLITLEVNVKLCIMSYYLFFFCVSVDINIKKL